MVVVELELGRVVVWSVVRSCMQSVSGSVVRRAVGRYLGCSVVFSVSDWVVRSSNRFLVRSFGGAVVWWLGGSVVKSVGG